MPFVLMIGIALWFWFGDPAKFAANLFYKDNAAPWETVDAFYYPSRNDLTVSQRSLGLPDIAACRAATNRMAYAANDIGMLRGDYECGVGKLKGDYYGLSVYRITVK